MARCLDDHPDAICFCESKIHHALFPPYNVEWHFRRMRQHGFGPLEIVRLLTGLRQAKVQDVLQWYADAVKVARSRYAKPKAMKYGDKSPDFYTNRPITDELLAHHRVIYTIRDPRAIFLSISKSQQLTARQRQNCWQSIAENWELWEPHLSRENVLVVRYEEMILDPSTVISGVYDHVGLSPSSEYATSFTRKFPKRFISKTAVDHANGTAHDFDPTRLDRWKTELTHEQRTDLRREPSIDRIMLRFGYA